MATLRLVDCMARARLKAPLAVSSACLMVWNAAERLMTFTLYSKASVAISHFSSDDLKPR